LGGGPFAQACLNEALSLSVGLGRVRFGAQVLDFEQAQRLGVTARPEADAFVGHDAVDLDAEASKETQRALSCLDVYGPRPIASGFGNLWSKGHNS
jgi:hypothetical protein